VTGVLVVGGSIGGVRTIQQLRRMGYAGTITLVEAQDHLPYDRPPLSKAVLETSPRRLHLADGSSIEYDDALVIATGARARRSPWSGTPGVHELRSWDDAVGLRQAMSDAKSLVVVGAGFIGAEVASAARKRGLAVDIIDVTAVPMGRHFGAEVGGLFTDLHLANGVVPHFGTGVTELTGSDAGVSVVLADGTRIEADLAAVGLGIELNTEWLAKSGLEVEDGVVCDPAGRADAAAAVYAVGDVARWWHPGRNGLVRSEHWTNAVEQATVVAHNITHPDDLRDHDPVGYVWSNQYDWKIQIAGNPALGVRHELVHAEPDRILGLWADEDDQLCGVLTVNWPQLSVRGRQALAAGRDLAATYAVMFPERPIPTEPTTTAGAFR